MPNRFETWHSVRGLGGDGVGHLGMGVAQADDGDAAEEVEVAPALVVPQLGARSPHERDRRRRVRGHERRRIGVDD